MGVLVRSALVPTIKSLRLLGPRLLVIRFRGNQRDLSIIVAHAPHGAAEETDREDYYTLLRGASSSISGMDTKVVLMDANAGPGKSREGWEHLVGPHGIPYPVTKGEDAHLKAFGSFCFDHQLCVGHTWFEHKKRHKISFYPTAGSGGPKDMDHVLIDTRSGSCLEDVKVVPAAIISTSHTHRAEDGELIGHRVVLATLHCRLQSKAGNVSPPAYVRNDCLKKEVQAKIQETLTKDSTHKMLANNALMHAGQFGLLPDTLTVPPCINTEVLPTVLPIAVDNLVDLGNAALIAAASAHAPVLPKEKRFKQPYTSEPTMQMSLLRNIVNITRYRVQNLGWNTLTRAAFETLRAWRLLRIHNRGHKVGTKGVPANTTVSRRTRVGGGSESAFWPIHNVRYRKFYIFARAFVESIFKLLCIKTKKMAHKDRLRYWDAEASTLEDWASKGHFRALYQQIRFYAGKQRPPGVLFLQDANGNSLDSPEDRMTEWTREFSHRFNAQVSVLYECTAGESDEEWQDDTRDDDATSRDPAERARQKQVARSQLLPGHSALLNVPSRDEVSKGLMSAKLHRSAGLDGITAELIRAALPWLIGLFIMIWKWTVAAAHVAQTWKDGVIITLFKKKNPSRTINYRGITLLAVLGKCFLHVLMSRLIWIIDHTFYDGQYGFRPYRGRSQGISVLQRLIEAGGTLPDGIFALFIDLEQCFDRIPRRRLWRVLRKRGLPKRYGKILRDLYSNTRCKVRSENLLGEWFKVSCGVRAPSKDLSSQMCTSTL